MAYFSNSDAGLCFAEQCSRCKYGEDCCPVALIQMQYNYSQFQNADVKQILDWLVKNDGTCTVFELMEKDLAIKDDSQLSLFDEVFGKEEKDGSR